MLHFNREKIRLGLNTEKGPTGKIWQTMLKTSHIKQKKKYPKVTYRVNGEIRIKWTKKKKLFAYVGWRGVAPVFTYWKDPILAEVSEQAETLAAPIRPLHKQILQLIQFSATHWSFILLFRQVPNRSTSRTGACSESKWNEYDKVETTAFISDYVYVQFTYLHLLLVLVYD